MGICVCVCIFGGVNSEDDKFELNDFQWIPSSFAGF